MFSPLSDSSFFYQRVDFVFYSVLLLSISAFLAGEIYWFLKKLKGVGSAGLEKKHFETAWSLIPWLVLLFLTCVQNQFFSPVLLKKIRMKSFSSQHINKSLTDSETQTIKEEIPKTLKSIKSNSAVRM